MNNQLTQEIHVRQRIEEALKRSEEQHRIVLETTPDPVIVYNTEGEVAYLNPAFFRVFGWELPDVAGQPVEFVPVEKLYETRVIFEKIKQGEMISGIETSRMTKNGKRIEVSL